MLLATVVFVILRFYIFFHAELPASAQNQIFYIKPGSPVRQMVKQLAQQSIITDPTRFLWSIYWKGASTKIMAGEYAIAPHTTHAGLIEQLRSGKVVQHAFTIVPGWNFTQLLEALAQTPLLTQTLVKGSSQAIVQQIGLMDKHPEGQFFPETYYFPRGTTDVAFLQRAHKLLRKKLEVLWEKYALTTTLGSPYEVLILASIIEKESAVHNEYAEIAGVYHRRLQKNMLLQADPTVAYGLGMEYKGMLSRKMLEKKTPYNTYKVKGLPPTPIALTSEKALEAALNPNVGNSLYFVADPNGKGHVFSETLQEHQIAVKHYRHSLLGKK